LAGFSNCCGRKALGVDSAISLAFSTAPFMPWGAGVSTSSAPNAFRSFRRSMLMLSGMVRMQRYPLKAAMNASPMPVLPLVGSTMTPPGFKSPRFSPSSIMARAIRSFTLESGLRDSSFTTTSAFMPAVSLFKRTSGVLPMSSRMFDLMFIAPSPWSGVQRLVDIVLDVIDVLDAD
jgi:hypothetical protein